MVKNEEDGMRKFREEEKRNYREYLIKQSRDRTMRTDLL